MERDRVQLSEAETEDLWKVQWKKFHLLKDDLSHWMFFPCLWNNWIMKQHIASLNDIRIFASVLADILEFVYAQAKLYHVYGFSVHILSKLCTALFHHLLFVEFFPFLVPSCHREWICWKRFHFVKIEIWVRKGDEYTVLLVLISIMTHSQWRISLLHICRNDKARKRRFLHSKIYRFSSFLLYGNFHIEI